MKRISVFANFAKWGPDGGRPAYRTRLLRFTLLVLVASFDPANAATTVRLPGGTCAADDTVFAAGFEPWIGVPSDPSRGSGGAAPGAVSGEVFVPGLGSEPGGRQVFHLYVPSAYTATRAWPLVIALHGAAGSHAQAGTAQTFRESGARIAAQRLIVVVLPLWALEGTSDLSALCGTRGVAPQVKCLAGRQDSDSRKIFGCSAAFWRWHGGFQPLQAHLSRRRQ